jgi:hypothetical protein
MAKRGHRNLFVIFEEWLRLYLEIFSDFRVLFRIFVDCILISDKSRGLFAKWWGFSGFGIIFEWKKMWWPLSTDLWTAQG